MDSFSLKAVFESGVVFKRIKLIGAEGARVRRAHHPPLGKRASFRENQPYSILRKATSFTKTAILKKIFRCFSSKISERL
ncbi:hypothetical protein D9X91_17280 [Falsibacillus albus]|uniref:Uncharacterized protein n=1 Tax=Falsibacillus albus TaxID=2478915 RepID=A0A3L7JRM0_9BACI|nr:hypothetical protein D9X91_17280 [Falsibacillus albus]